MEQSIHAAKPYNRFAIPLMMGLVIAAIKMVFTTVQNMFFIDSFGASMLTMLAGFAVVIALLITTGKMQRKAMGGTISLQDAFQGLFVCILVVTIINYAYDMIYIRIIDPGMLDRMHASSISQAEKIDLPQDAIDEMNRKHAEDRNRKINIGKEFLKIAISIALYSVIAFICAQFVRTKETATSKQIL